MFLDPMFLDPMFLDLDLNVDLHVNDLLVRVRDLFRAPPPLLLAWPADTCVLPHDFFG